MFHLDSFKHVDVYLLDQYFKGNFHINQSILDAGCGQGRNCIPFINEGFQIDLTDKECNIPPEYLNCFEESTIKEYVPHKKYDFIICNAVLHFSENTDAFMQNFKHLCSILNQYGILFIRMTSNFGLSTQQPLQGGLYLLKDGTTRFLLTKELLTEICEIHHLIKIEPVKTTLVEDLRAMTTLVLSKKN